MGRAARERHWQHLVRARMAGGCTAGPGGSPCDRCKNPPKMRPGDVIDFERAGLTPTRDEQEAVSLRRAGRGLLALLVLFVAVAAARCVLG